MSALENEKKIENTVALDFSDYDSSNKEKRQKVVKKNYSLTRMEANTEQNKGAGEIPELTISELAAALYGVEQNEKIPQNDIYLLEHVYLNEIV